eukprot:4042411-Pleurochrysis_carterae.AAC.1
MERRWRRERAWSEHGRNVRRRRDCHVAAARARHVISLDLARLVAREIAVLRKSDGMARTNESERRGSVDDAQQERGRYPV